MAARTNEQWLSDLRSTGIPQEIALTDLRAIIVRGLPYGLSRWLSPTHPQFSTLVEEVAQETLLRVMDHLDDFEGRSQFTTWVYKIAIRTALSELRRQRWKDISLEKLVEERNHLPPASLAADPAPGPERLAEREDLLEHVQKLIREALTEKQQQIIIAAAVEDKSMDEIASQLGTNRNALYKLLFDARTNLKKRLLLDGLTPEDVLAVFEKR